MEVLRLAMVLAMLAYAATSFLISASPVRAPPGLRAVVALSGGGGSLEKLSVGELKSLLSDRGIDFRDCLEKQDLIERLAESAPQRRRSSASAEGLTESESRTVDVFRRVSPSVAFIQTVAVAGSLLSLRGDEYRAGTGSGFVWDENGHVRRPTRHSFRPIGVMSPCPSPPLPSLTQRSPG